MRDGNNPEWYDAEEVNTKHTKLRWTLEENVSKKEAAFLFAGGNLTQVNAILYKFRPDRSQEAIKGPRLQFSSSFW